MRTCSAGCTWRSTDSPVNRASTGPGRSYIIARSAVKVVMTPDRTLSGYFCSLCHMALHGNPYVDWDDERWDAERVKEAISKRK